jgi:outer membrane protein assembly factor BamB
MRRSLPATGLLLAAFGLLPAGLHAAKVKVWHHHSASHYDKAQLKQAVVSSEGTLRLARELKLLAGLDATHVWDVIEDKSGNLIVATGNEGKLFRVAVDGTVALAFTSPDTEVLSLALAPDGTVYAGTGPKGLIVALPPEGKARIIAEGLDRYVWSLALDADGKTLYAGTGPKGRIYQVTPEGKASVFYATRQEHILCLAMGPNHMLYAGTDKGGLVYRIDPRGKGFVLYQAPQGEVRSLLVTADGYLYAGTSAPMRRRSGGSNTASVSGNFTPLRGQAITSVRHKGSKEDEKEGNNPSRDTTATAGESSPAGAPPVTKANPAPAAAGPGAGENSLYQIAPDGTVRELFRDKTLVLSMLRARGAVLVGTGMQGQLFEIDEKTKERCEIARLDHGQIHTLCRRRDGSIIIGTGDPGKLYVLRDRFTAKGTVVSDVLDAKIISKWGALTWKADMPAGTAVTVAMRSGNVAEPDETWSEWSAEQCDPQSARVTAPSARFLQYRVTLTTERGTISPALHSLAVRYQTTNQAPEITALEVPDLDAANLDNLKKLKLRWTAVDPNEDELAYSLYIRKEGWKSWVQLEDNLDKKEYIWDTSTVPTGVYRVKVVASDHKDNAAGEALTASRISAPFPVSHVPPTVTVKVAGVEGEQAVIEATAMDPLVRLTEASFAVNGKRWVNVFPSDGLFDTKKAHFRFKTEALRPGTYVLVLRVRDAAGNIGSGDIVFTVQPRTTAAR